MRLWSKQLVKYLPNKQLIAQWREILAILGNIKKRGFPNHILVNKIRNYPLNHFSSYAQLVLDEMKNRNYKTDRLKVEAVTSFCGVPNINYENVYSDWHDEEYIKICLYNLYEKYLCGGIPEVEWDKIYNKFGFLIK